MEGIILENKKIMLLVVGIAFIALSYGMLAGTFELFPFEIYNKAKEVMFSEHSRNYPDKNAHIYDTNPTDLIKISNQDEADQKRNELIQFIWKDKSISNKFPSKIIENFSDSDYDEMPNLKQIDRILVQMENDVDSKIYHFIPNNPKNLAIIYHQGHGGDFLMGKKTIEYFVDEGYDVLAFMMPLYGKNNQPIVDTNFGKIHLINHNHLTFLDTDTFTSMKFFVEPIAQTMNYLEEKYEFDKFYMVGLSGGGLTVTIYSALDERISETYSIAGSYPIYLEATKLRPGHYEYLNMDFYQIANYLELYILSSYGNERKFVQIFNEFDLCCYEGTWFKTYEDDVTKAVYNLEQGEFLIYLDSTHTEHKISEHALEIISTSIKNSLDTQIEEEK